MVLPIEPISAASSDIDRATSEAILNYELQLQAAENPTLTRYRAYYDGDQSLVFGTEKFRTKFGSAFEGFRDNWCAPVIEAPADKLFVEGILLGTTEEEMTANSDLSRQIWNVFRANDIDEQQADLHEGALVEGRSYMICWPVDDEDNPARTVSLDWNPADLVRVRYADDNPRKIVWAMKRWLTPSGKTYITVYTRSAIYKYEEMAREIRFDTRTGIDAQRPTIVGPQTYEPRIIPGERWPLPNPYGIVPVVEFLNKRESELHDVIPLQNGVNYLMLQGLSAAGFQGFPQRGFMSGVSEPVGGWSNEPGQVWQLPPDLDAEGNLHYGSVFEFQSADLSGIRSFTEMVLQHIALQTKTPVRLFMQSDRGGRGDAPSGESLLVDDQPLLDKVEDRQNRFGNSWYRVAQLVARMDNSIELSSLPLGEVRWKDPRAKYRSALVEEGAKMVKDMGMPLKFVASQMGFTADEMELLNLEIAAAEEKAEADKEAEFERQVEMAEATRPEPAPNQPPSRPPAR